MGWSAVSLDKIPPTGGTPPCSDASVSGSTSAALTGNGLEAQLLRHLKATSCFLLPRASPGVVPLNSTPKPSQGCIPAAQGDRMVDITTKLTKRQSRDLRGQVRDPGTGSELSL